MLGAPFTAEQHACKVLSAEEILPRTRLMWVEAPWLARGARPGQFVMLRCGADCERMLRRPLTVHALEGERVAFLFQVVGSGTGWLAGLVPADTVDILGPLGNGFTVVPSARRLLLMAGGLGIAPLRFLCDRLVARGLAVTLVNGARTATALYPRDALPRSIEVLQTTEDGSAGEKGLATDLAPSLASGADQVFACGPLGMYRALHGRRDLFPAGPPIQVSLEVRMGCGVGACLGCTVPSRHGPRHVCTDGPVFDLEELDWAALPDCLV